MPSFIALVLSGHTYQDCTRTSLIVKSLLPITRQDARNPPEKTRGLLQCDWDFFKVNMGGC
jgi:hypothetical protein